MNFCLMKRRENRMTELEDLKDICSLKKLEAACSRSYSSGHLTSRIVRRLRQTSGSVFGPQQRPIQRSPFINRWHHNPTRSSTESDRKCLYCYVAQNKKGHVSVGDNVSRRMLISVRL